MEITRINENIYRSVIPYKNIFTTVYLIKHESGVILFDAATTEYDVENYIVPMLLENGVAKEELKYVFISHAHGDHIGGLRPLLERFPKAVAVSFNPKVEEDYSDFKVMIAKEGDSLLGDFSLVAIPGHSADSAALFDKRTKTLITGDCLQAYGLFGTDYWGANVSLQNEYFAAIEKLRAMEIEEIYTAHDFVPYGFKACGKEAIAKLFDACKEPILKIRKLILENPSLSDPEIRALYNNAAPDRFPPVGERVVAGARAAMG
jgi:glyoxylase-like metal-dependent hydrolase (beta-lactamase superfamily II)